MAQSEGLQDKQMREDFSPSGAPGGGKTMKEPNTLPTATTTKGQKGDSHNIINLRNFTTKDTEFHGGEDDFRIKNSILLRVLRGFYS